MQSKKKLTAGRSMVEMLGVLAIIGVLSIGGIMGFRRAMDTHHVNNLMNDVSLLGMAVATRDQAVYNADCHDYEESNFTIPTEFATCKATYGADDLVVLTVTYNDQMPDRVIHMIENRCTQGIYVSAGATQFTVGSHGWNCELAAMERDQEPEDPSEWECQSANDCGYMEECRNHHCARCSSPRWVGPNALSEFCCQSFASYEGYPITYTNGQCVWKEEEVPDEYKCAIHQRVGYDCFACLSSNQVMNDEYDAYCCGENESKSACCSAVGLIWCEKLGTCVSNTSECEAICDAHMEVTDLSTMPECNCQLWLPVYDPATDQQEPIPVKAVCCTINDDGYDGCCKTVGGYWENDKHSYQGGICYSEKPPKKNCVEIIDPWNSGEMWL